MEDVRRGMEQRQNELQLYFKGKSHCAYQVFGAHPQAEGTLFSVWAPHADQVMVCGDFNGWDGAHHEMKREEHGVWRLFIQGVKPGAVYKYGIQKDGRSFLKADPYAGACQLRPDTASVVTEPNGFSWQDQVWQQDQERRNVFASPVNIYEVHLGSFVNKEDGSFYSYREIAPKLINYLLEMSYNYVEFMPLCEYPLDASWGYQITGYYAATRRYGTPDELRFLVDQLHLAGIGVLLDWVPGHFCRDAHGLYRFDGTPLYESSNAAKADNPGWGTANFDFEKPEVQSFLLSNAAYWFREFHIDGLRVDAVANMLFHNFGKGERQELKNQYGGYENVEAIAFLRELNTMVAQEFPGRITAAEDSTDWPHVTKAPAVGGLGFTFKWNMGWMNDSLSYMKLDPIYRKSHHEKLTFPLCYAFSENYILPISHDEVVHGKCSLLEKMPGYRVDKLAQVRSYLVYMYGMPGKKLLFMGCEFAHALEWRFYEQLEWNLLGFPEYAGVKACSAKLNQLYLQNGAFWQKDTAWEGFRWCDANDRDRSILSFARFGESQDDVLVFACNFTPVKYENYLLGVPRFADYQEILNTDNIIFGGANILNRGLLLPKAQGVGEMPYCVSITLPPLGAVIFRPYRQEKTLELS